MVEPLDVNGKPFSYKLGNTWYRHWWTSDEILDKNWKAFIIDSCKFFLYFDKNYFFKHSYQNFYIFAPLKKRGLIYCTIDKDQLIINKKQNKK